MKKIALLLIATLALAGCNENGMQVVKQNNYIVVTPPTELYDCPVVKVPNTEHLTNVDVARYILNQYKTNVKCYNNIMAIKSYVEKAKAIYGQ